MKYIIMLALIFLPLLASAGGDDKYTPTKLEWLAIYGGQHCNIFESIQKEGISVMVLAQKISRSGMFIRKKNTIFISVSQKRDHQKKVGDSPIDKSLNSAFLKSAADMCIGIIESYSAAKGWSWVKFETDFN
jgi:hypothetical protein